MSGMEGNPHVTQANKRLDGVHEWQAEEGSTDETMQALSLDALTEATLALAYEQRTANLIAYAELKSRIRARGVNVDSTIDLLDVEECLGIEATS